MSADGHLGEIGLNHLRLHAGEPYISQLLYLSLLRHLGGIELVPLGAQGKPLTGPDGRPLTPLQLNAKQVEPVGFAEDEALIPYPLNTFRGYRYLQEYFAFPDKFLFVDLKGTEIIQRIPDDLLKQARGLELRFDIHKAGVQRIRPTLDNVRLYCTPVVNLFPHDAIPIRRTASRTSTCCCRPSTMRSNAACFRWIGSPAETRRHGLRRVRAVRILRA